MERRPPFCFITGVKTLRTLFPRPAIVGGALLLVLAAALPGYAAAQAVRKGLPGAARDSTPTRRAPPAGTIDGFVGDSNLVALQAAEVRILSSNVKVSTGPNGRFRIERVPVGQYVVIVRRAGFRPTSELVLVTSDTLRLSYTLERGTTLDAAVVTAERRSPRMAEFEMRRKLGRGDFMTEDDIKKRNSVYTTELLRRFQSVSVGPSYTSGSGGMPDWYALSKREGANPQTGACPFAVFVDNVSMPTPFNLDMLPSPRSLAGIEVYNGTATTPPQYSGTNRGCGVILIWTKDGY